MTGGRKSVMVNLMLIRPLVEKRRGMGLESGYRTLFSSRTLQSDKGDNHDIRDSISNRKGNIHEG